MYKLKFLVLLIILPLSGIWAASDWKTTPLLIEQVVTSGDTLYSSFTVYNESDRSKTFTTSLKDWEFDQDGKEPEYKPGTLGRGCASWMTFSPQNFEIPPHSSQSVRVYTVVPQSIQAGSYWGAIFVQDVEKQLASRIGSLGNSFSMYVSLRNRVSFLYTVQGELNKSGTINYVSVNKIDDSQYTFVSEFNNTGNMVLKCTGTIEIRNTLGETVSQLPMNDFYCMVGNKRTSKTTANLYLEPGEYTALVIIDFSGDYLVAGETLFNVR